MGFSTSLQGQASHEALLARQDAEIKLLETMRRCLTMKVKSDREYASTVSSLIVQGKKIERSEDLVGSLIVQVTVYLCVCNLTGVSRWVSGICRKICSIELERHYGLYRSDS